MKRLILTAMIAGLLAPAGLHAQRVYKDDSNRVILDMTEDAGMPADAITDVSKATEYAAATHSNNAMITNNGEDGSINAKVYHKLEVAPHDLKGDGAIGAEGGTFTWLNAFKYCMGLNHDDETGWRLPTQRELIMMYIFKPALEDIFKNVGGTAFRGSVDYCSATEHTYGLVCSVKFFSNVSSHASIVLKTTPVPMRCVREL